MGKLIRSLAVTCLLVVLGVVILVGCSRQKPPAPAGIDLSSTLVPNLDLDAYVYIKQESPTNIPKSLIAAPSDLSVESLAIWGVAQGDEFNIGGALRLASAADAARIRSQIPGNVVWTAISDRVIYFVQGSGAASEKLRSTIARNDFKYYQDEKALTEVAQLPNSAGSKMAAVAMVKPSQPILKLLAKYGDRQTSDMINTLVTAGRVEWMTAGLYAPKQIDIADVAQRLVSGSIWGADLGIAASVKSGLPGFLITPIASKFLENAGYVTVNVGGLSLYKGSLDAGGSKTIPVLLSLDGDRMFAAASGKESYAQTLITSVKR